MCLEKDSPASGLRLLEYIKGHLSNSRVLIMSSNATTEPSVPSLNLAVRPSESAVRRNPVGRTRLRREIASHAYNT